MAHILAPLNGLGYRKLLSVFLVLICFSGFAFYFYFNKQDIASLKFDQYLIQRQYEPARELVNQLIEKSPQNPQGYYLKARLELALDEPEPAMNAMRRAFELGYPEEQVQVLRALLLARASQFSESESILVPAYRNKTGPLPEIAEGLTLIYLGRLELTEAAQMIDIWKKAAPLDDRPYLLSNEIDERIGSEPDVLIQNYVEAIKRNPSNFKARITLAKLLLRANRIDESLSEWQSCNELEPKNPDVLLGLAQVALLQGNTEKARELFLAVLQVKPDEILALSELSQIELQSGNLQEATKHLQHAIVISPFDAELFYKLSQTLKLAGEAETAKEMLEKSNRLKADESKIQDLRKTLVQEPDNIAVRVEAAQWLMTHGHEKEGLEWAELVLKQSPANLEMCQFLVKYYQEKGEFGLANYYRAKLPVSENADGSIRK